MRRPSLQLLATTLALTALAATVSAQEPFGGLPVSVSNDMSDPVDDTVAAGFQDLRAFAVGRVHIHAPEWNITGERLVWALTVRDLDVAGNWSVSYNTYLIHECADERRHINSAVVWYSWKKPWTADTSDDELPPLPLHRDGDTIYVTTSSPCPDEAPISLHATAWATVIMMDEIPDYATHTMEHPEPGRPTHPLPKAADQWYDVNGTPVQAPWRDSPASEEEEQDEDATDIPSEDEPATPAMDERSLPPEESGTPAVTGHSTPVPGLLWTVLLLASAARGRTSATTAAVEP